MHVLVVLLLVAAVVCGLIGAFAPPVRPQMGSLAVALIAAALLIPQAQGL
jgi:hypothetical protein